MLPPHTLIGFGFLGLRIAAALPKRRRTRTLADRLAQLPVRGLPVGAPARIRWNDHHVPFIEARSDRDLAVALGVVHAHLRLTQIEFMRRAVRGRLAEVLGPAAIELDHVLRTLGIARAVPRIRVGLPDETRDWMMGFAEGINSLIGQARELPEEFGLLGFRPEPWSLEDVLAVGRLAATDFTWKLWVPLLRLRDRPDWLKLWERMTGGGLLATPSLAGGSVPSWLGLVGGFSRSGSNSVAVGALRSATGRALIASDPHLPVVLPNPWLAAGYKSPGYHCVGLMLPGVPAMAMGRNPWIAWGGTSLHAASSDLFDVTDLPEAAMAERRESIRVRWWRDVEITVRETRFGPVLTDAPILRGRLGRRLALRWIGHLASDETTALLAVNRARDWTEFRAALDGYAVPALNMVYADAGGRVGLCMAARLPRRPQAPPTDVIADADALRHWDDLISGTDLPARIDPAEGVAASANNRPPMAGAVPVGFFFSPDDRVRRLHELTGGDPVTMDRLKVVQRDVFMASALDMRDRLLGLLEGNADGRLAGLLRAWNGRYDPDATAPAAFEMFLHHVAEALHGPEDLALFAETWEPWSLIRRDLETRDMIRLATIVAQAAARTEASLEGIGNWGDLHRLRLEHPLGAVPGIGARYRFADLPVGGGNETLMKTAHGFSKGRHTVRMGAVARHVSDLGDPDANDFCLLGGQDGWLGSTTFLDQLPLWREGRYVRLPLGPEAVCALFAHETVLGP